MSNALTPSNPFLEAAGKNLLEIVIQKTLGWSLEPFRRLREMRTADALDALQEELRLGNITEEEFTADAGNVASVLRLLQCADEGTARRNLRMLAQIIKSQHAASRQTKDEFQGWAPIIASLSTEEIAVLGVLYRRTVEAKANEPMDPVTYTTKAYNSAKEEIIRARVLGNDADFFDATLSGLTRTGLVMTVSAFGGLTFKASPLLGRLAALIEMERFADEAIAEALGS